MFKEYFSPEETPEEDVYAKARLESNALLDSFEFINKEEIREINPEKAKDEVPVFVSPGWGVSPEAQIETLQTISKEGRKVMSVSFIREQKIKDNSESDMPIAELQKALTIIEAINKSGASKVDAIGHSEGGLNLAIAASLYPEKFRNIVFIAPAGMVGKEPYQDLLKRFAIDEGIEELKMINKSNLNSFYEYFKSVLKHFVDNPILSHQEIKEISQTDILEMTKYLKEKGVGVGLVCGVNDRVFPIEKAMENVNKDNFDYLVSTKGNHGSFIFNKEHAILAEDLLADMANKKS